MDRWREPVSAIPSADVVAAKAKEGWKPVAIEWAREPNETTTSEASSQRPIPYGLRISADCSHLEVDPVEREVMSVIVAMIAADHPLSRVAAELNRLDYRPREGPQWSQVALFRLLPRIVEFGPEILGSEEWSDYKTKVLSAVS
jgi:hypothetical protein